MITGANQNQIPYTAVKDVVPQRVGEKLPQSVQNFDVKESVDNNTAVKAVKDSNKDPVTLGLTGGIWLTFAHLCQKLNNNLAQDWDKSWLGKFEHLGDKISNFLNLSERNGKIKKAAEGFIDKFKITRALKTPTRPQNSMAISQARGITSYVMSDVSSMLGYHVKNGKGQDVVNLLKNIEPDIKDADAALKYIDDLFKNCDKKEYAPKIKALVQNMSKSDIKVSVDNIVNAHPRIPFTKKSFPFKIPNIPFLKRKGSFKEMGNKINAVMGNNVLNSANATQLGKALPKQALKGLEGLTNGGAGGKLLIVIQASIFAQAVKKAMDAPKGEKWSTFTENIANDFGFFLSLPLQVKASHMVGGLKYIGIGGAKNTAEQIKNVDKYRSMIKSLNEKVANGAISAVDYAKQKDAIKNLLKGDSKWYHKPLKAIGNFFSKGLDAETIKPFVKKGEKSFGVSVYNTVNKWSKKITGKGAGTVLRLGVGMMVAGPLVAKLTTKVSHLIFGKPTKSVLDKEEDDKKPKEVQNAAQDGQINPELNMSEEEFAKKLAEHPELLQKMEADPQFMEQMLKNPQMLAKVLNNEASVQDIVMADPRLANNKYITLPNAQNGANQTTAQNLEPNTLNSATAQPPAQVPQAQPFQTKTQATAQPLPVERQQIQNPDSSMDLFGLGKKKKDKGAAEEEKKEETNISSNPDEPVRTYVPSSKSAISGSANAQQQLDPKVSNALSRAEAAEKAALEQLNA